MKKLKFTFKSLTMKIWTTFTAVILIIIFSISLIYLLAARRTDENDKFQDLKLAHEYVLKSDSYNTPGIGFDSFNRKLKDIGIFIFNPSDSSRAILDIKRMNPIPERMEAQGKPTIFNDRAIKMWMTGYIKDDSINEEKFKESFNGQKYIFIVSSIQYGADGKAYLISCMPLMENNQLLYMVISIGAIFIVFGFVAAKIAAGFISKPLKELEKHTLRIAQKDWKEPIYIKGQDEIGRLAEAMNHMQRELRRADEEEKMFLQSISHDLKTPVMVIMSHADAIIDGVYIDSVEETAEIIKDEAISLEKKIKQMLYLNTLDYVLENKVEDDVIKLNDMMLSIINRFEVINSKIEWDLDMDRISIKGSAEKIQVAIENILDNGLRYAQEEIKIKLKREDDYAVLDIYNDGANIDSKHIGRIFDNLYKDKTGNFGLGLAISKKIIDFHRGKIEVVNRDKGVSFIIKLPL